MTSPVDDLKQMYRIVTHEDGTKMLHVRGDAVGLVGEQHGDEWVCPLSAQNARLLRQRLPWLNPQPLGTAISAGFGDRLGIATPGHAASIDGTGVAPIFAQQSVRENQRTERTPQQVLDDAMWGVLEYGWQDPWGADADHLKTLEDVAPFVEAGYTFFTIDPGDFVDDDANTEPLGTLQTKIGSLDWETLQSSPSDLETRLLRPFDGLDMQFDNLTLTRAAVKYGNAVAHTVKMARHIQAAKEGKPFDLEVSVDETETTTSLYEHLYIAAELQRLGVPFVSLAPRFVGRFEKGVDYIGDLDELEANIAGHAAIMRHFDSSYKLSLHTGSDKFGVYPFAVKHTSGHVHLKTAGTSYLEALRTVAHADPALFREILEYARERYEEDRRTYHVSAQLANVPTGLSDEELPNLLDQFDARQVLHVTFGSVLNRFGERLHAFLRANLSQYHHHLEVHFNRHLEAFRRNA